MKFKFDENGNIDGEMENLKRVSIDNCALVKKYQITVDDTLCTHEIEFYSGAIFTFTFDLNSGSVKDMRGRGIKVRINSDETTLTLLG